jgi:hypothetical protein
MEEGQGGQFFVVLFFDILRCLDIPVDLFAGDPGVAFNFFGGVGEAVD